MTKQEAIEQLEMIGKVMRCGGSPTPNNNMKHAIKIAIEPLEQLEENGGYKMIVITKGKAIKPLSVSVESMQFKDTVESIAAMSEFVGYTIRVSYKDGIPVLKINTLEGTLEVREGDIVIKNTRMTRKLAVGRNADICVSCKAHGWYATNGKCEHCRIEND